MIDLHFTKYDQDFTALFSARDSRIARSGWNLHFLGGKPYLRKTVRKTNVLAHRQVCGCVKGDGKIVDHINGDTLDNRRENLRVVTNQQNLWNKKARAKSGYFGVQEVRPGVFTGRITHCGKFHYCGSHESAELAALAVNKRLAELRGEFACLNEVCA